MDWERWQELYATEQYKIDKTVYSTDELQAYAIYKPELDTYKETKDKATIKYNKDLEALETEFDKVAKKSIRTYKKELQRKKKRKENRYYNSLKKISKV